MLDENLPTFFLKSSPDSVNHHEAYFFSQHGSEPIPAYTLQHADPFSPNSRNCYAAGLFDAYNPDVLFGEVLIKPEWTQPSLSQEDIRKNGGVPPPPQPVTPTEFAIQLYDPNQQVIVRQKSGTWGGTASYEFQMPVNTFRLPSVSTLDRTLNDPAADLTTPKINFVWRREGKMSKDLTCFMTGKSTDPTGKKKKKGAREPDIAVALFRSLRELTIYESNMYRVDIEDPKGLEVVLLLAAAAIRDVYFGQINETFNIGDPATRKNSGGILQLKRKSSSPLTAMSMATPPQPSKSAPTIQNHAPHGTAVDAMNRKPTKAEVKRQSLPLLNTEPVSATPPLDPRAQWELDVETARLRTQNETEAREQRRKDESKRRSRAKVEDAEQRRIRKMVEAEEKEARRKQAEVDRETDRLRRKYGSQEQQMQHLRPGPSNSASNRYSAPLLQGSGSNGPYQRHSTPQPAPAQRLSNGLWARSSGGSSSRPSAPVAAPAPMPMPPPRPRPQPQGLPVPPQSRPHVPPAWMAPQPAVHWHRPAPAQSQYFGGNGQIKPDEGKTLKPGKAKKSLWGLRSKSDGQEKLKKKKSSMF